MNILDTKNIKYNSTSFNTDYNKYIKSIDPLFYIKADLDLDNKLITRLRIEGQKIGFRNVSQIIVDSLGSKPSKIELISKDNSNHIVFLLNYKNKKYILKMNFLGDYFIDFNLLKEVGLQDYKYVKLISPKIKTVDVSRDKYSFDYLIEEFIDGISLAKIKDEAVFLKLGKTFKKIHSINTIGFGPINTQKLIENNNIEGLYRSWQKYIYLNLDIHLSKVMKTGIISSDQKDQISHLFNKNIKIFEITQSVFLHNDPSPNNIIINKSKVNIIDWEDSICGDYLWDIAFFETFMNKKFQKNLFQSFCKGYGLQLDNIFKSKKYNLYYLRIMLFKIVIRSNSEKYDKKDIDVDKARLEKVFNRLSIL